MLWGAFHGRDPQNDRSEVYATALGVASEPATGFQGLRAAAGPQRKRGLMVEMALGQACPPEYWRAQCAFKDSMIH